MDCSKGLLAGRPLFQWIPASVQNAQREGAPASPPVHAVPNLRSSAPIMQHFSRCLLPHVGFQHHLVSISIKSCFCYGCGVCGLFPNGVWLTLVWCPGLHHPSGVGEDCMPFAKDITSGYGVNTEASSNSAELHGQYSSVAFPSRNVALTKESPNIHY